MIQDGVMEISIKTTMTKNDTFGMLGIWPEFEITTWEISPNVYHDQYGSGFQPLSCILPAFYLLRGDNIYEWAKEEPNSGSMLIQSNHHPIS